jgi:hypothetical protein
MYVRTQCMWRTRYVLYLMQYAYDVVTQMSECEQSTHSMNEQSTHSMNVRAQHMWRTQYAVLNMRTMW